MSERSHNIHCSPFSFYRSADLERKGEATAVARKCGAGLDDTSAGPCAEMTSTMHDCGKRPGPALRQQARNRRLFTSEGYLKKKRKISES